MLLQNQHPLNKSIMVSLLGVPNAGKSTLINTLLGEDLSIVTNKPQTTRNQFHCTFNVGHSEVILVDTPGIHRSKKELNKRMLGQTLEGMEGIDLVLLLVDLSEDMASQFMEIKTIYKDETTPVWIVFTKSDLIGDIQENTIDLITSKAKEMFPQIEKSFVISTKSERNIVELTNALGKAAIPGPHLYGPGVLSNKNTRFFVAEYIREQAFELLKEELPYELAVVIEEYTDLSDDFEEYKGLSAKISASILVNRPSQRAIVVGARGSVIKEIGAKAREKIEVLIGGKIYLSLHVKVSPRWFKNNFVLEEIGLPRVQDSKRVWRKQHV